MGKNGGMLVRPAPAPAAPRAGMAGRAGRAGSEEVKAKPARPVPLARAAVGMPTMANFFASFFALGFQMGFSFLAFSNSFFDFLIRQGLADLLQMGDLLARCLGAGAAKTFFGQQRAHIIDVCSLIHSGVEFILRSRFGEVYSCCS